MKKAKVLLASVFALVVLFFILQLVSANNITYLSSTLWTDAEDVQVVGDYAYCAFRNGLLIFDVSDPANPSFAGKFYLVGRGGGIYVKDSYAYLADRSVGLVIFDVSDPGNPDSVNSYSTLGGS